MSGTAELLLSLAVALVLTALPGVAAALWVAYRGVRSVPILLAAGLAASGGTAMLAFWAYYADPLAGETLGYLLLFGSVALSWCVAGLRATYPRFAVALVTINASIVLVAYTPSLTPLPGTSYSPIAAALAALSLAAFAVVSFCGDAVDEIQAGTGANENGLSKGSIGAPVPKRTSLRTPNAR